MKRTAFGVCATLIAALGASGETLRAGVSACDITPDVQRYAVPMAGYGARGGRPSTGVHDPLFAKVLYLESGPTRLALITTDLRSVTPALKEQVLRKAGLPGLNAENVLICASHNHSGPSIYAEKFWQLQFGTADPAVLEEMTGRMAEALRQATAGLFDARMGSAETLLEGFTRNRRWDYDQAARAAAGEAPSIHPRLWALRVDDAAGRPKAILVNFATHPTLLGADNFAISAEWPGALQARLETAFPGATVLYTNGAEGDQAPAGADGEDDFARVEDFAGRLAAHATVLLNSIVSLPESALASFHLRAPLGEPRFSEASRKGPYAFMEPMALEVLPRQAEIQILRLGDAALVGLPGEPICEVGLAAEAAVRAAGIPTPVVIGLANDYIGYILNAKEYAHGGYEVDQRSYYGPTLGERIAGWAAEAVRSAPR